MKQFKYIIIFFSIATHLFASEIALEKVKLQLQWKHQFEFAGFYAAQEKGFYKEVGLDVDFIEFKNDTNIVDTVLNTDINYGISYSSIIAEYLHGKPIVFLANFFKQSPLVLVTQKEITTLSLLKGKKIQGLSNSINNISLYSMLKKFDIKDSDIDSVPLSFSLEPFKNKEVSAFAAFVSNEPYILESMGVEYNVFNPSSYGITYYDTNLFTSKEELEKHPLRVKKFKEASIKGWDYALKHKNEIIELIMQKYNSQNKTKEAFIFEANQVEHSMLTKIYEIGAIDINRVKILAEDFIQSGFVKRNSNYPIENFIYNDTTSTNLLTSQEIQYLKEKKSLTVCVDPNWMPIEAVVNSKHVGIASDYWKHFEKKLGVKIDIFKTNSWNGSLEAMKQKKCEALSLSAPTQKREEDIRFTDPFLELSFVIVTQTDKKSVIDFSQLDGVTIAVVQGYALVDAIEKKYPNINIYEVHDLQEGLDKVTNGEVFGFADSAVAIDYAYKNGSYSDFKVSAHFDEKLRLGIGVAKDNMILFNIFQKTVASTTKNQRQDILKKWFFSKYEKRFDYTLFWVFSLFAGVIFSFVSYRHYSIRELNKELEKRVSSELEKSYDKDKMIFHQSKLVAMGEMMENIAHQWRQPLSQVNSCVLLIDDTLDEKGIRDEVVEDKLQEIESLTKYMSNTIDDFKNFFDRDKLKVKIILEDVIRKSLDVLKGKIKSEGIKIIVDFRTAHTCSTYANELQQVLLAILNNAIDSLVLNKTSQPSIKLEIQRDEEELSLTICDNAGGINEDIIDKVFEPYYTTKHKTQGTGLGLYISKVIIEDSLGGELSVKNNTWGACFKIKLKCTRRSDVRNG